MRVSLEVLDDLINTVLTLRNNLNTACVTAESLTSYVVNVLHVKLGLDLDEETFTDAVREFKQAAWRLEELLEEAVKLSVRAETKEGRE